MPLPPLTALDGSTLAPETLEGKVLLIVNVASKCGFTPQYEGLQGLWEDHKRKGLVVIGVPCNQFGAQEPGTAEEIASFCSLTYDVDFPMLEKQDANGDGRSPLFHFLIGDGADIRWNFEKFLVGRDGQVLSRYPSRDAPEDEVIENAIAKALATS